MLGAPSSAPVTFFLFAPMMLLISAMVLVTLGNMLKWCDLNQYSTGNQNPMYTAYVLPTLQGTVAVFREALVPNYRAPGARADPFFASRRGDHGRLREPRKSSST